MHHNESNTELVHVVSDTRDKALLPCACSFNGNPVFPAEEARNIGSRISRQVISDTENKAGIFVEAEPGRVIRLGRKMQVHEMSNMRGRNEVFAVSKRSVCRGREHKFNSAF
jgi:hypothetical protein